MELDPTILPLILVFGSMLLISVFLIRMRNKAEEEGADDESTKLAQCAAVSEMGAGGNTAGRNHQDRRSTALARMRRRGGAGVGAAAAAAITATSTESIASASSSRQAPDGIGDDTNVSGSEEEEQVGDEQFNVPRGKKKKEVHKEAKRAATAAREAAIAARKEKEEKLRQREEEKELARKEEEQKKKEEEARIEQERLAKEQEEYEQWKSFISVEDAGDADRVAQEESQGLLSEFIGYMKLHKVIVLEELASEFGLRTQDVVNRVQALEQLGSITGVFDERGKFIYVSPEEMEQLAAFIKKRGRVSISELVDFSSKLILSPAGETGAISAVTAVNSSVSLTV